MNHKEDEEFKQRRHAMIAHKVSWICVYIVMLFLSSGILTHVIDILFYFIDFPYINILQGGLELFIFFFQFYAAWWITHYLLGKYSWG
ncbi:hypothetical protein [Apilactobacillus micheneri]|uniref:Uncharacterized protein n=1 Tax=Apilactobacillus micheneri TaxID=1899430 RepID=A0A9Q8INK6_9LACO|nr:hypothetical protein [Apilactobacillus micheneri]TPR40947.1 hypothetical protein DY121_00645 [Apilactobacillus micheneri]TPR42527.1 hypothetical protein DY123_00645 [Apilactobacillus micheneri]TPR46054.1 hypothetical protein DY130_00645 [Apilactobacillus micheneri]TPR46739.1 hypothetical protein DY128_00645 [Apilactobacillus micheneri]TPR49999.1 hypothetical protein DY037_02305 [Apilactobacillus micheneri]